MNTSDHDSYVKTKAYLESLKMCTQTCACNSYDLYGGVLASSQNTLKSARKYDSY